MGHSPTPWRFVEGTRQIVAADGSLVAVLAENMPGGRQTVRDTGVRTIESVALCDEADFDDPGNDVRSLKCRFDDAVSQITDLDAEMDRFIGDFAVLADYLSEDVKVRFHELQSRVIDLTRV